MKKSIKTKNQHYVPQYYFRLFSDDGKTIQVYDKYKKQHYKNASIKNQCSEDYFLGKDSELEHNISTIEVEMKLILDKLKTKGFNGISDDEYKKFLTYLCFQHKRTRHERNLMNELSTELHKQYLEVVKNNDKSNQYLSEIELENIKVDDPKMFVYSLAMSLYAGVLLSDLKKCYLINNTSKRFVFSDSPVVFHNSYYSDRTDNGVGYQSPGLQIIYPISNYNAVLLYDSKYYKCASDDDSISISNINDILQINLVQMLYCSQLIYFSNPTDINILQKLRKKHDKLFERPRISVEKYQSIYNENGELIKHHNTLFNLKLTLSFLNEIHNQETERHVRNDDLYNFFQHMVDTNLKGKFKSQPDNYDVKVLDKNK